MRWLLLILLFVFIFIGINIYGNAELIKNSYTIQRFQSEIEETEKENALLKKEIFSHLSLRRIGVYAREKLNLAEPQEVRYIRERFPQKESESSRFKFWNWIKELISPARKFLFEK